MAADSSALLEKLSEGAQIKGIVKNLTDYGAFVDLGGLDGLLHITDISWKRVKHPSEVLEVGQELDVKVLSFDKEKNRVALGLKQLCSDPWHGVAERYKVKSRIFGEVTNITDYGCFVEIENGIEGLVHMSEMDWTNRNIRPNKIVNVGDEVEVMIIDVDESKRRISLGIKQCIQNPWVEFADNHELGNVVSGNIKSITDFGIFVGLEGGIDGLVHLTDISWKSNGEEAIRDFKRNDEITAKILSIDPERERISLSIREMSADPYLDFFASHDAEVTGTVTAVDSKRVTLELAENVFGSIKEIEFKSKGLPEVGAEVTAFIVSHERKNQFVNLTLEQTDTVAKTEVKRSKPSAPHKSPTLGDLIKDKMSGSE
jgi:small subunit ribosomal protein S1